MNITRINWPDDVPKKLAKACCGDISIIKKQVESGVSHLYKFEDKFVDLLIVTRGEEFENTKELVIVCAAGDGIKDVGQFLIDAAKMMGFNSIRYHAKSEAVHRLYHRYGFGGEEVERVYKIEIGEEHGR